MIATVLFTVLRVSLLELFSVVPIIVISENENLESKKTRKNFCGICEASGRKSHMPHFSLVALTRNKGLKSDFSVYGYIIVMPNNKTS